MQIQFDDLVSHPFFKGMPSSIIEELQAHARVRLIEKGETVIDEGGYADSFFLIKKGRVAIRVHGLERGDITIQTIEDGEILGWSWMVEPYIWNFDAIAAKSTLAFVFDAKALREKCTQNYELGFHLMQRIASLFADRLRHTRMQLLDVYGIHTTELMFKNKNV
jgi:CRP-like cAMP-binding protein